MSTREKLIKARLGMLALAEELQNISLACRRAGISGRETCGRPLAHLFELYLTINQIEHRRTQVGSPETNGFCERFHRTLKEEFFSVACRRTFYESMDELQRDLDVYLEFYNRHRSHQGYRTKGRTPYQTFLDAAEALNETEVNPEAA